MVAEEMGATHSFSTAPSVAAGFVSDACDAENDFVVVVE